MKTTFSLTILFLFIAIGSTLSQTDFRDGFIITLQNDTIRGEIAYRSNSKNYKSCIFKLNKKKTTYLPNQIVGFGYEQGAFFSTQIVKDTFVEVLVVGKLSLFKSKSKYLLRKENEMIELVANREMVEENGEYGYRGGKLWRRLVYAQIKDCTDANYDLMDKLKFDEKRLTKLVVNYNKCSGANFIETKANQPWTKLSVGVMIGLSTTTINNVKNQFDFFEHLDDTYTSTNPSIGVGVEFSFPRISDKIAIRAETHFIKSSYASFLEFERGEATEFFDTYIVLNTLSIPVSIKYIFLKKKVDLYVESGVSVERNINGESRLFAEKIIRGVVTTEPVDRALEIKSTQFGYWGGIGLEKKFEKISLGLSARYVQLSPLNKIGSFTARNNRFSVNLIFSRSKK